MTVNLEDMSRSYPFLWIAKNYGVDYDFVIELIKGYDGDYLLPPEVDSNGVYFATYAVCKAPWRWKFSKGRERGLWCDGYSANTVKTMLAEARWREQG